MRCRLVALSMILFFASSAAAKRAELPRADHLQSESSIRPLNVDVAAPRLSWRSTATSQIAYQVQVSSSRSALQQGRADLWDSGRTAGTRSLQIPYAGKPLESRQTCHWRVRVWDLGGDSPGPWSEPSRWEMGLLSPGDWSAQWIRGPEEPPVPATPEIARWIEWAGTTTVRKDGGQRIQTAGMSRLEALAPATLLRRDFTISKPLRKARLYSAAAGYAEIFLDGRKVGRRILNPAQTDYDKRILYDTDDVEEPLSINGPHTLAVHLGDGWYGQNVAFSPTRLYYGRPAVLVQLELTYTDGETETMGTDASWLAHPSPTIKNSIYAGEVYDARRGMSDWNKPTAAVSLDGWRRALSLERPPTERLQAQRIPKVKVVRDLLPQRLLNPQPGVWVFDFGQNFAGLATLHLNERLAPANAAIYLRFAEWADDHGRIDQESGGGFATTVNQVDCYISGGDAHASWTPSFTWHGFRYVEVTGLAERPELSLLTGHLMRSDVPRVGSFSCSDPHLNRVHETALWTYESNLVGIPSDCPVRERCGWTGDAHATVTMSNWNFGMGQFWQKYLEDFRTSPFISPAIVPGKRGGQTSPDWAVAQVLIAWEHYLYHDDLPLLQQHYSGLAAFMDHMQSLRNSEGIIERGYGDWCDPVRSPGTPREGGAGRPQQTPPALTTTALFIHACDLMQEIARVLGDVPASDIYARWRREASAAFHGRFFDAARGDYGSQTGDAMALCFHIVPPELREAVAASLNRDVLDAWKGHASVGALGQPWLYPALSEAGYADTALGVFYAEGHPGFHYLFDELRGTTLWERKGAFDPANMEAPLRSLSHPFQGGYDAWFYQTLGGIRPDPDQPGFKHFFLQPQFPPELNWVKVDYDSDYGPIRSHWTREGDIVRWSIHVPANSTATALISAETVDMADSSANAVLPSRVEGAFQAFSLPTGQYEASFLPSR